jgi:histidine triad (HIT) family protein
MDGCLFCDIAAKKIKANILYENDQVLAFLDVLPRTTGHTLVIPKIHAPNLLELPDEAVGPLFLAVKHVGEMLKKGLQPDGITIGINQGRASGQEVDHLHVHLMPRWQGDGGGSIQSVVHAGAKESVDDVLKKIMTANG